MLKGGGTSLVGAFQGRPPLVHFIVMCLLVEASGPWCYIHYDPLLSITLNYKQLHAITFNYIQLHAITINYGTFN